MLNERQLTEQLLIASHPYFSKDEYGDKLQEAEKTERIRELKEGFLINLKREKETDMREIHKAVGIILEDLDKWEAYYNGNIFRLLRANFVFSNGKCALYPRTKTQRKNEESIDEHGHMPKHVKKHFDMLMRRRLTPEEINFRQQYLADRPHTQFIAYQQGQLSEPYRPWKGETP